MSDDKSLVSGGHDHTIRFWDVQTGTETDHIVAPVAIRTVHLTADGEQTMKVLKAEARKAAEEFLAPLSGEERTQLNELLRKLAGLEES